MFFSLRKSIILLLSVSLLSFNTNSSQALESYDRIIPTYSYKTRAKQAIVIDYDTGEVLYEKNADNQVPPSSMSKLMTLYMLFDALQTDKINLTDEFTVGKTAAKMGKVQDASRMFLTEGMKVTVEDLIKGIVVSSANDGCIVVAENLSGTEETFALEMMEKAEEIGLKNSNFVNSSGWPDKNHYMSTRDLAILANAIIRHFPEYYHYFSLKEFAFKTFTFQGKIMPQFNRNKLLWTMNGADGLKTGHTDRAGFGMVASFSLNGRRLIGVINGLRLSKRKPGETKYQATNRQNRVRSEKMKELLDWSFREYNNYTYYEADDVVTQAPTWFGKKSKVNLSVKDKVAMTLKRGTSKNSKFKAVYNSPIVAPIRKGDILGKLILSVEGKDDREFDLVANEDVKSLSLFGKFFENISQILKRLFTSVVG